MPSITETPAIKDQVSPTEVLQSIVAGAEDTQNLKSIQEDVAVPYCWIAPDLSEQPSVQTQSNAIVEESTSDIISDAYIESATESVVEITIEDAHESASSPSTIEQVKPNVAAVSSVESMQEILVSAGLTLAATDPEKLRTAQEAAKQNEPAPRLGRARKPLQILPSEPLILVDTKRD